MANLVTVEANNILDGSSGFIPTVASVTLNATTSATVASGGFPNVASGMYVSGTNIASGTQVQSVSGNTLTLTTAATGSGTVTLTFSGYAAPIGNVMVALNTAVGSATAAGTEVTNSGGSTYSRQHATFSVAASGSITTSANLTFTNMPALTVTSIDEWDSATTPIRRWFGSLNTSKTTNLGDTLTINAGSYTKTLS